MEHFGKKIAALPTSSQYGKDWTEAVLPHWEKQGGKVVYNSSIDFAKETDFFTIVTNALKKILMYYSSVELRNLRQKWRSKPGAGI